MKNTPNSHRCGQPQEAHTGQPSSITTNTTVVLEPILRTGLKLRATLLWLTRTDQLASLTTYRPTQEIVDHTTYRRRLTCCEWLETSVCHEFRKPRAGHVPTFKIIYKVRGGRLGDLFRMLVICCAEGRKSARMYAHSTPSGYCKGRYHYCRTSRF